MITNWLLMRKTCKQKQPRQSATVDIDLWWSYYELNRLMLFLLLLLLQFLLTQQIFFPFVRHSMKNVCSKIQFRAHERAHKEPKCEYHSMEKKYPIKLQDWKSHMLYRYDEHEILLFFSIEKSMLIFCARWNLSWSIDHWLISMYWNE